jgi:hypothetical protein
LRIVLTPRIEIAEKVYCRRSQHVAGRGELFIAIMATMDRLEAMRLFVRVAELGKASGLALSLRGK